MSWDPPSGGSGGGGGGGAVTVADGADVTQGAIGNAAWDGVASNATVNAILKAVWAKLNAGLSVYMGSSIPAGANTIGGVNVVSSSVHTAFGTDTITTYEPYDFVLWNGALWPVAYAKIDVATSGDQQIVAAQATPSRRILVISARMILGGTCSVKWRSGSTDLEGAQPLVANTGYSWSGPKGLVLTASNTALNLNLSTSVQCGGSIAYAAVI